MIHRILVLTAVVALGQAQMAAQIRLTKTCTVHFATPEQGKSRLAKNDAYIKGLSPFERAAKILKAGSVSTEDYIDFIGAQTLEWDENDKAKLKKIIQIASSELAPYARHIPPDIYLIKTTGKDEGAAPYTRGVSIVLPNRTVRQSAKGLERLFYHELFHIISRKNTKLRDELYALIGFHPCGVVSLPDNLMPRRISNPDAPVVEHCILVTENDMPHWVAPVLFSRIPEYDPKLGGTFFRYLEMRLMAIDRDTAKPILRDDKPVMFQPRQVEGFFEQIGNNTSYILHPEETLANNFVFLMTKKQGLANPEIPEKIGGVLLKPESKN
jgi:hypothetical protein